jgi:hypothetical protein
MLGDALSRFTSTIQSKGESLAGEIIEGAISTAREIRQRIEEIKNEILGLIADALQLQVESRFSFVPGILLGSKIAGYAGTLEAGTRGLYALLSAERTAEAGLNGSTDVGTAEARDQRESIRAQASSTEELIDRAVEFGNNSNLASTLAGLSDGVSLIDILRGLNTVVGYFLSGLSDAFATGAGIGSLININVRHHVAAYNLIVGDSL